ncbi:hypothetical protein [Gimesia aquarii]|nr:hypothetical protein [Gimesia aquarii]
MNIDSINSSSLLTQSQKREQDHQIQNLFSALLTEAGRKGYASAEPVDNQQTLTKNIQKTWDSWFTGELGGRYTQVQNPDELKHTYGEILVRAHNEGGYVDPKGFLQSLSHDELAVIQKVQALASGIKVESLTEEGALNLLLPPAAQVDLNQDGLTRSGLAYGMKFPDSNTPAAVVNAWEDATEDMSFRELAFAQLQVMLPKLTSNIVLDENGSFLHRYEPGDAGFKNPMAASDYSYIAAAKDQLAALEYMKNELPAEQYERQKSFWSKFQQSLIENGAS